MSSKETIISLLSSIKREGIDNLIKYLGDSTFFIDPASCQDHNSYEGGLADHSLAVYQNLNKLRPIYKELTDIEDSLKIVGLLHDICLTGTFQKVNRNIPLKGSDGKNKKSENGKLIFVEKESYDYLPEAHLPYPQGQLSTLLIKKYIKLTKLEDLAIQWHRGVYEIPQNLWGLLRRAQKIHKLIILVEMADLEASLYLGNAVEGGA